MNHKTLKHGEFSPKFEGEFVNAQTLKIVREAGQVAQKLQTGNLESITKTCKEDFVTQGDLEVTRILKQQLPKIIPDLIFIDEESSETHDIKINSEELYVVIDPIDGTTNYFNGAKEWGVSVGFVKDGQCVAGIIFQPSLNKIFYAELGKGAYINNKQLKVSDQATLSNCSPQYDFPYPKDKIEYDRTSKIISRFPQLQTQKPIRLGSQVIAIMKVAETESDFFFHLKTKPWDVAAAIAILTEAGGRVLNMKGESYKLFDDDIVFSNQNLNLNPFFDLIKSM